MLAHSHSAAAVTGSPPAVVCTVVAERSRRPQTAVQALMMPRSESSQDAALPERKTVQPLLEAATECQWTLRHYVLGDLLDSDRDTALTLTEVACVLLDADVAASEATVRDLRHLFPHALFVGEEAAHAGWLDLLLPNTPMDAATANTLLHHAGAMRARAQRSNELLQEVAVGRARLHQLSEIGMALSSQQDGDELLHTILNEARRIAHCDAASLYLIEGEADSDTDADSRQLVFKLAQNDSVQLPQTEMRLPLTTESLAGYVALTGHELNLEDVYALPEGTPYTFNRSLDESSGYRTRSMLVMPMRDYRNRVVGVLQFMNRLDEVSGDAITFAQDIAELLRAVASQAAIAIQKGDLLRDINQLFESFVQASVKTIERRDPATSGHSFRVARTTVALFEALPQSGQARFSGIQITPERVREIRYAALLHDVGKIGVSERVLTKPRKLSDDRLEILAHRVELQKERLRRRAVEQKLELYHHGGGTDDVQAKIRANELELASQLSQLDDYFQWVRLANEPNVLDTGTYEHLQQVREYAFREIDGTVGGLITDADLLALSVRRGSLTPEERREIQSHVVHTQEFLATLQWPPELAMVPVIAGAHHEKLDGSGYPQGLAGEQIPLPSRVMTVCDIYDALTAMDRPYKPAMSVDTAFAVLRDEADQGLLDSDIVEIFIASGAAHH